MEDTEADRDFRASIAPILFEPKIDVSPQHVWFQGRYGLVRAGAGIHAETATAIIGGMDPLETEYGRAQKQGGRKYLENKAVVIATMIAALKAHPGDWPFQKVDLAVDGSGKLVAIDGAHRTGVAVAVERATIPARVLYRDQQWVELRYNLWAGDKAICLYQPSPHPDFAAWPVHRRDTFARCEIICAVIPAGASGFDIGCNTGALSLALANRGYTMTGMDVSPARIEAAKAFSTYDGEPRPVKFSVCGNPPDPPTSDFGLCLSLLHYFMGTDKDEVGRAIFRAVTAAAPRVILDAPAPGDGIAGDTPFTNPENVLAWCRETVAGTVGGAGRILAPRGERSIHRVLLIWER